MARGSLGPFPKTLRFRQILYPGFELTSTSALEQEADRLIELARQALRTASQDPNALYGIRLIVGLIVSSRFPNPDRFMKSHYGIQIDPRPTPSSLGKVLAEDESVSRVAARKAIDAATKNRVDPLFESDPWLTWRGFDGSPFCDLARSFYGFFLDETLDHTLRSGGCLVDRNHLARFCFEASIITRSFSARWFNACARFEVPDAGSIRWFQSHCLGKLDIELERELSTWVEAAGASRRRRRVEADLFE